MRFIKTVLLVLPFILLFNSCSQSGKKVKVGMLFGSYLAPRWDLEKNYFEEKVKELGGELLTKITEGDELQQLIQARELISSGVDVLVIIAVNGNNAGLIVREAHKKGIKVIAYDILIKNTELDLFITFSGERAGELMAEYTVDKIPQGNYALLYGDGADDNAIKIKNGVKNILQPYIDDGRINIIYETYNDQWATENAEHITGEIIEFSDVKIDAIIATFNSITYGAEAAVGKLGLTDSILVVGHDPDLAVCQKILAGKEVLAVHKTLKNIAHQAAEFAFKLANNQAVETNAFIDNGRIKVPSVVLDPVVVDKNNIQSIIFDEGFLKKQDVINYEDHQVDKQ